ncbi:unnamed protein product [Bemisia tabaci]|uniref:Uncharacterized protein n=1 Tax=Bemisia tabaci TaxID=7038 RepID=A0A9N9ZXL9_BEMTA|nr:unnamed protein product [Bemisia tabaci]
MPEQSNDYRVVVFGAGGVGKSSLVLRFIKGNFREDYIPTIEDTYIQDVFWDDIELGPKTPFFLPHSPSWVRNEMKGSVRIEDYELLSRRVARVGPNSDTFPRETPFHSGPNSDTPDPTRNHPLCGISLANLAKLLSDVTYLLGDVTYRLGDATYLVGDITYLLRDVTYLLGDVAYFFGDVTYFLATVRRDMVTGAVAFADVAFADSKKRVAFADSHILTVAIADMWNRAGGLCGPENFGGGDCGRKAKGWGAAYVGAYPSVRNRHRRNSPVRKVHRPCSACPQSPPSKYENPQTPPDS